MIELINWVILVVAAWFAGNAFAYHTVVEDSKRFKRSIFCSLTALLLYAISIIIELYLNKKP